ncbi:hypothetical protein [Victivallis vadensis]|uniref:hypothetical protein n=1 Tax=Victivallis vadensis TaxID=172901 RepID=UPI0011C8CFF6|nr:hypothetical protein [Victivallis vadensis]
MSAFPELFDRKSETQEQVAVFIAFSSSGVSPGHRRNALTPLKIERQTGSSASNSVSSPTSSWSISTGRNVLKAATFSCRRFRAAGKILLSGAAGNLTQFSGKIPAGGIDILPSVCHTIKKMKR